MYRFKARKFFVLSVLSTGSALLFVFVFLLGHRWWSDRRHLLQELEVQTSLIGANASAALAFRDENAAAEIVSTATRSPQVLEAALYTVDGNQLAHYQRSPKPNRQLGAVQPPIGHHLSWNEIGVTAPVMVEHEQVGAIAMLMSLDGMYREVARFALALLASAVAATLLAHLTTRQLRRHMHNAEEELRRLALYDRVTGLANRHAFELALEQDLNRHLRSGGSSALLFIDVDGFKKVNDVFGHQHGDIVLRQLGERLRKGLRSSDIIARIGGDEFGIILVNTDSPNDAAQVARQLIRIAAEPFALGQTWAYVGLSIGIAMVPQDGTSTAKQMLHADMAMYHAKQKGKNNYQFFSEDIGSLVRRRLDLESALHGAIANKEFEVVYQPQFHIDSRTVESLEALVRWNHPERGLISPSEFIPIAEESGLIIGIGRIVMERVCHDISLWRSKGLNVPRVAINTSARQLAQGNIVQEVIESLGHYGLHPDDIEIELTESVLMEHIEEHKVLLSDLSSSGIGLAIDDFGTGYSSLSYLRRLPLNKLKIDMSFVHDLEHNQESVAIVRGIINLAHTIDLKVVAEGVETEQQAKILQTSGCDLLQGYLLSKPLIFSEMTHLLSPAVSLSTS